MSEVEARLRAGEKVVEHEGLYYGLTSDGLFSCGETEAKLAKAIAAHERYRDEGGVVLGKTYDLVEPGSDIVYARGHATLIDFDKGEVTLRFDAVPRVRP